MGAWWEDFETPHDLRLSSSFRDFASAHFRKRHERSPNEQDEEFFEDYLKAWLLESDAVELAGGDFATYLQAVVIIVADVREKRVGGELFGAFVRHPYGLLGIEADVPASIDRHFWNEVVFRRQLGQRPPS